MRGRTDTKRGFATALQYCTVQYSAVTVSKHGEITVRADSMTDNLHIHRDFDGSEVKHANVSQSRTEGFSWPEARGLFWTFR